MWDPSQRRKMQNPSRHSSPKHHILTIQIHRSSLPPTAPAPVAHRSSFIVHRFLPLLTFSLLPLPFRKEFRHQLFHLVGVARFVADPQGADDAMSVQKHRGRVTEALHVGQAGENLAVAAVGIDVGRERRLARFEKALGLFFQFKNVFFSPAGAGDGNESKFGVAAVFIPQFHQVRKLLDAESAPWTPVVNQRDFAMQAFQRDAFGRAREGLQFQHRKRLANAGLVQGLVELHVRPKIRRPDNNQNRADGNDGDGAPMGAGLGRLRMICVEHKETRLRKNCIVDGAADLLSIGNDTIGLRRGSGPSGLARLWKAHYSCCST
jgi:hypothetical protein